MSSPNWQKSSYSSEASNCLEISAARTGEVHLRESDDPRRVLTAPAVRLRALLQAAKTGAVSPR